MNRLSIDNVAPPTSASENAEVPAQSSSIPSRASFPTHRVGRGSAVTPGYSRVVPATSILAVIDQHHEWGPKTLDAMLETLGKMQNMRNLDFGHAFTKRATTQVQQDACARSPSTNLARCLAQNNTNGQSLRPVRADSSSKITNSTMGIKIVLPELATLDELCLEDYDIPKPVHVSQPTRRGKHRGGELDTRGSAVVFSPKSALESSRANLASNQESGASFMPSDVEALLRLNPNQLMQPVKLGSLMINKNDPDFVARVERDKRKRDYAAGLRMAKEKNGAKKTNNADEVGEQDENKDGPDTNNIKVAMRPTPENAEPSLPQGYVMRQRMTEYAQRVPKPKLPPVSSAPPVVATTAEISSNSKVQIASPLRKTKGDPLMRSASGSENRAVPSKDAVSINEGNEGQILSSKTISSRPGELLDQSRSFTAELAALEKVYQRELRIFEKIKKKLPAIPDPLSESFVRSPKRSESCRNTK